MKAFLGMVFALLLGGCSADANGEDEAEQLPNSCEPSDSEGTYLLHLETRDGNCGDFSDRLVTDGISSNSDTSCIEDFAPRVTEGGCKLEASATCDDPAGRGTYQNTLVVRQQDEEGDRFTGLLSVAAWDTSGAQVCRGTYDVTATRQ